MPNFIVPVAIIIAVIAIFFVSGYLKAPPDTAYIISGLSKKRRILIGKAGWRCPFFERIDRLSLRVMQVDVKTSEAVPTNEFINVTVDGVANIKISSDPAALALAAEALLGMRQQELIGLVTQVLEGNMREIVGSVGLKEMVQDRQGVAKKITENVVPDMKKLGIEVVNFNIQNFKDAAGTIENMGIDNVEQIRKNAQIAKANAQRDIAIATAKAQEEANAVRVESEKKIAEQNAELAVQQADMKVKADTKRAEADAAYSIQQENQRKTIEITKANADIARKEKEAELAEKAIALKERELDAEIRKQADALKYRIYTDRDGNFVVHFMPTGVTANHHPSVRLHKTGNPVVKSLNYEPLCGVVKVKGNIRSARLYSADLDRVEPCNVTDGTAVIELDGLKRFFSVKIER